MRSLLFFFPVIFLFGCNSNKIESLENELSAKSDSIRVQKEKILVLEERIEKIITEQNAINRYSDEEIIKIFKDNREFTTPKGQRKNFEVRKINENRYQIRYDYRHPDYLSYKQWSTSIYEIEFLPNDQYRLKWVKGNEL